MNVVKTVVIAHNAFSQQAVGTDVSTRPFKKARAQGILEEGRAQERSHDHFGQLLIGLG